MKRFLAVIATVLLTVPLLAQTGPDFERILLPVFTPPVHGAFGSEFRTDLRIANLGSEAVVLHGLLLDCPVCLAPIVAYVLGPGQEVGPADLAPSGSPGRFLSIRRDAIDSLAMSLRVHDVTRDALNYGTEIPFVREDQFAINRISFVGVPTDPRFRNTLRIYTTAPIDVLVTIGDQAPVRVALKGGSVFEPGYGIFTNFPAGVAPVRVTIEADPDIVTILPIEVPLWAFITVTNNDTQVISTITPQP